MILSGRITDWEFRADLDRFTELLPVPGDPGKLGPPTAEAILGRALRGDYQNKGYAAVERGDPPLVVLMAPLDDARVRTFAAAYGIGDSDPFIKAIEAADLWFLARRPLDLQWLVAYWKRHGRFGGLAAMIETSLQERLRETNPQHAHDDSVDPVRAMQALEQIGAAMVFGRVDKIAVEDSGLSLSSASDALRLEEVLPDWAPAPRRQLLTRAIFDPATYGCVRLHNDNEGTVRAFLTARWLRRLRDREGSVRAQLSRLFTETYRYPLIRPSLRLTSAWLSLCDPDIASEVIAREPDLLLTEGDPGSLSTTVRSAVLRRVIEEIARTGDRIGPANEENLRRLAAPDLSPTVRTLWRTHKDDPGCRHLLPRLIALGTLSDCADIASEGISGAYADGVTLVLAGRALMASANAAIIEAYANRIRAEGKSLPAQVLWEALDQLAPRCLSVEDFLSIVERMDKAARTEWPGIDHFAPRYADRLHSRADLERLFHGLTALLNSGSAPDEDLDAEPDEDHLKLLAKNALRLMQYVPPSQAPIPVIDIAMRIRSVHRHRTSDETSKALIETLSQTRERRREVFWHIAHAWAEHRLLHSRPLDSVWAMSILGWPKHLQLDDLDWILEDTVAVSTARESQLGLNAADSEETPWPPGAAYMLEHAAETGRHLRRRAWHVHKRAVELPLARTAPKARGLTAKSCPGPSPLRRQLLRITKMRGIAMPDNNRHLRRRRATALPLSQIHSAVTRTHTRLLKGGPFLASKTGLILDSAPGPTRRFPFKCIVWPFCKDRLASRKRGLLVIHVALKSW